MNKVVNPDLEFDYDNDDYQHCLIFEIPEEQDEHEITFRSFVKDLSKSRSANIFFDFEFLTLARIHPKRRGRPKDEKYTFNSDTGKIDMI